MTEHDRSARGSGFWPQLRGLVLTTVAVVIIATAILVGLGRALLPLADELRPWIEMRLSERIGQEVSIDQVEAQWPRLTPRLTLIGLQLTDDQDQRLELDAARLEIHLPNLLNRQANLLRLVLLGLEVALEADEEGRWGAELAAGAAVTATETQPELPGMDLYIQDAVVRIRPPGWPELVLRLGEGEIQRRGDRTLLYGSLEPEQGEMAGTELRVLLHHPQGRWTGARGWLKIEQLALADWVPAAAQVPQRGGWVLDLEAWLDWSEANDDLRLDLDFGIGPAAAGYALDGELLLTRSDRVVQGQLGRLRYEDESILRGLALARSGSRWVLAADWLDLAGLHAVLDPWAGGLEQWPSLLGGQGHDLVLGVDRFGSVHAAAGQVNDLTFEMADPYPSVTGLDLTLGLEGDRLQIAPSGRPALRWPHLIRGDVAVDELSGELLLAPDSVELRGVRVDAPVARASADGWIYLLSPRPFLDLLIRAERVGPTDPRPYLSYRTIPPPAMAWLDEALVWIEEASGEVHLHMRAGTLARDLHPGSYQARVEFRGVDLDYWPDWPAGRGLAGQAEFIGKQLSGRLQHARVGEIALSVPDLLVEDLTAPDLTVSLQSDTLASEDLTATLAEIPVPGWQAVLEPMQWRGPMRAAVDLALPLRRMSDWQLTGQAELNDASMFLPALGVRFSDIRARLAFDRQELAPTRIETRVRDQSLSLDLAARFAEPAWLEVSGELNPADLLPEDGLPGRMAEAIHGRSQWRYRLQGRGEEGLLMQLDSDLQGLVLDWPEPLTKPDPEPLPFQAEWVSGAGEQALAFIWQERLSGRLTSAAEGWSAALAIGPDPPTLPPVAGLSLSGRVERLALDEWLEMMAPADAAGALSMPENIRLQVALGRLDLPGLTTGAAELKIERSGGAVQALVDSPELAGRVDLPVPADAGLALVVDIDRLYLPGAVAETLAEELADLMPAKEVSRVSPRGWPPVSLVVEDLRRGELEMGRLRLEAHPGGAGLELELIDLDGPELRLQGRGRWLGAEPVPTSRFIGRISASNLSSALRSAGYDAGIEAGRAQLDLDVQWPGSPADFSIARLVGDLELEVGEGRIPEARPGAGRLLGLINFSAIPRRLMLDFRDVFEPGMRFDQISGRFEMGAGLARTDGVIMQSPAAVITISGKTDMAARQYDQILVVEPGLGATLPVLGVLAGGPAGAAAGLVLRQLLDRPLRGVAEVRYRITGPWDSPRIELVDATILDEDSEQASAAGTEPESAPVPNH